MGVYVRWYAPGWWAANGKVIAGGLCKGGFCTESLAQMSIVRGSLIVQLDNPRPSNSDLSYWPWPLSAIFEYRRKHIGPFYALQNPTVYANPKTEFEETPPSGGILLPVPRFTWVSFSDLRTCHRAKFQLYRTIGGRVIVI